MAQFGNLYFHFDCKLFDEKDFEQAEKEASRFDSRDFENNVPMYTFEGGTRIYPITSDVGREFFLVTTETGGGSMKVIDERGGGDDMKKFFAAIIFLLMISMQRFLKAAFKTTDKIFHKDKILQRQDFFLQ